MTVPIHLFSETVRMTVHPEAGAVIRGCEFRDGIAWKPLLAPARRKIDSDPTTSSFFPMLPWCNRLSTRNVAARSGDLFVPQTWHTTPMPVHGTGWIRPWQVVTYSPKSIDLELNDNFGPYSFVARLRISLREFALRIWAQVVNKGAVPLPFGVGFHPYFIRDRATKLEIAANSIALTGPDCLPNRHFQWSTPKDRCVRIGRGLRGVSAFFYGAQKAVISSDERQTLIHLDADNSAGFLVWAPFGKEYFCVEPMSHQIDSFSRRCSALPHDVGINESMEMTMNVEMSQNVQYFS